MAAPLVAVLPAVFTALWAGLVSIARWCLNHAHVVKIIGVCVLITTAFKTGRLLYASAVSVVTGYLTQIASTSPQGGSFSLQILAKANYCLPVSEMLALLAVYVTLAGLCLALKMAIAAWKAVPFKSA